MLVEFLCGNFISAVGGEGHQPHQEQRMLHIERRRLGHGQIIVLIRIAARQEPAHKVTLFEDPHILHLTGETLVLVDQPLNVVADLHQLVSTGLGIGEHAMNQVDGLHTGLHHTDADQHAQCCHDDRHDQQHLHGGGQDDRQLAVRNDRQVPVGEQFALCGQQPIALSLPDKGGHVAAFGDLPKGFQHDLCRDALRRVADQHRLVREDIRPGAVGHCFIEPLFQRGVIDQVEQCAHPVAAGQLHWHEHGENPLLRAGEGDHKALHGFFRPDFHALDIVQHGSQLITGNILDHQSAVNQRFEQITAVGRVNEGIIIEPEVELLHLIMGCPVCAEPPGILLHPFRLFQVIEGDDAVRGHKLPGNGDHIRQEVFILAADHLQAAAVIVQQAA